MSQFKYVWLNINTGEFSNSWDEETQQKYLKQEEIDNSRSEGWKLIKYKCLSDEEFEFYNIMKVVTKQKN